MKLTIRQAVDDAKEEGFPATPDEKEAFFLEQVQAGELMAADRESTPPPAFLGPAVFRAAG